MFIDTATADKLNSFIETIIIIPSIWDTLHIIKVKTSISINIKSYVIWVMYVIWEGVYFANMGQYYSFYAQLIWILWYFIKIYVIYIYRHRDVLILAETGVPL